MTHSPSYTGGPPHAAEPALAAGELQTTAALRPVSWGAILAGVVVALVVQLLLNLFGLGVGLATIDPAQGGTPAAASLGLGAAIWYVVSFILALLAGAWVTARLAGVWRRVNGLLNGLVVWALTTLVVFYLLTTAIGGIVGGVFAATTQAVSAVQEAVSGGGGDAEALAQAIPLGTLLPGDAVEQELARLNQQARTAIAGAGGDPQALSDLELQAILQPLILQGEQADLDAIADTLANQAGMSAAQAQDAAAELQQITQQITTQLRQTAQQTLDDIANALTRTAFWSFVALLLGAAAAAAGGWLGTRTRAMA